MIYSIKKIFITLRDFVGHSYKEYKTEKSNLDIKLRENYNFELNKIWYVKEKEDHIRINDSEIQFINLSYDEKSLNGFQYLLEEFSNSYICLNIIKADKSNLHEKLKEQLNILYEKKIKINSSGMFSNQTFIDNEIITLENKIKEVLKKESIFYIKVIAGLLKNEFDIKKLNLFSSIFSINIFPLIFKQYNSIKEFFIFTSKKFNQYNFINNLNCINLFEIINKSFIGGIFIGHEINTNQPIFEDIFLNENYNSVIIAKSGAGKSFLTKMLIKRYLFNKINVITFDCENEYTKLCNEFDGVNISEDDVYKIDTFMKENENIDYLKSMLPIIFENKAELEEVQYCLYNMKSYKDLNKCIKNLSSISKHKLLMNFQPTKGKKSFNNNFINFNITGDNLKIILYKIVAYSLSRNTGKTILFIDEAHKVMDDENVAKYIRQVAKRGRKYDLGITIISQDILDFIQNKWSKAVISNATTKFLLKQESINIPLINKIFNIQGYDEFLKNTKVGSGLMIKNNKVRKVIFDNI